MFDYLLFVIFPYAALTLAVVVTVQRYRQRGFTYTSLSSQFLEGKELFYGSVPWHYGIMAVLMGHCIGILFPKQVLAFNGVPWRLYILESTGLLFGLLSLIGLVSLIIRRITSPRIRVVTSALDIVLLLLLLSQVALGVYTAIFYRWGSSWYAATAVPYLYSLFTLKPDLVNITPLPWSIKLHIINAYLLIAVFPFSRLVHMLVVPIHYLWRPFQVVIWNRPRRRVNAKTRPQPVATEQSVREKVDVSKPAYTR
ncbi:MAG: respiratory nitrate reductase subunit gamma [Acidobacteriota bacterium]